MTADRTTRTRLLRGGLGSLSIKLLGGALTFAITVVLARTLGPAEYGVYAFVFALVSLLAVPAELGLPHLVVRETARASAGRHWDLMLGLWRWSGAAAAGLSLAVAAVAALAAWFLVPALDVLQPATLAWGLALVPLIALGNLAGAALRGLRRVLRGQLPELVMRPGAFLLLLAMPWPWFEPTSALAMALHAAAGGIALAAGGWWLYRARPPEFRDVPEPRHETARWLTSALPLALVAGMHMLLQHTDVVMLGWLAARDEVGIYRVAAQGAAIVAFGLNAMNMVIAPRFAELHARGERRELQWTVTFSARLVLLLTLPVVALLAVFADPVIVAVFGADYAAGHTALAVLVAGQLANAAFGSVAFLLNMTGHERDTARGLLAALGVNILLNALLIPALGMNGAATATALSLGLWNILLWRAVRRRLGIDSTALGRMPPGSG